MDYQAILNEIVDEARAFLGEGRVASYIPALANVDPRKLGVAIETVNGEQFAVGDATERFSIQSISKVFNLVLGIRVAGDDLWQRVGVEPSGNRFNSLVQLEYENGIPRNPFINAGALVVTDVLLSHLREPNAEMLSFVESLRCSSIYYDEEVAVSERETGFTNVALVNFMKAHGNISNSVDDVLNVYFHQCSIEMSCEGLARSFLFLANGGVVPGSGERILTSSQTKRVNAIMLTCGFYDEAGQFAYRVGLPGKSGVGGGIVAVIPDVLSIAVWSPELNPRGNSLVGIHVLEQFTTLTGMSIF
ncbi:MAG: glutaminase [Proteobacteria bacterium]|nr:glutaminase [Pseudomonadota bacterium]MDA1302100.1 glutaminase [Pseudomonadota bacterium]